MTKLNLRHCGAYHFHGYRLLSSLGSTGATADGIIVSSRLRDYGPKDFPENHTSSDASHTNSPTAKAFQEVATTCNFSSKLIIQRNLSSHKEAHHSPWYSHLLLLNLKFLSNSFCSIYNIQQYLTASQLFSTLCTSLIQPWLQVFWGTCKHYHPLKHLKEACDGQCGSWKSHSFAWLWSFYSSCCLHPSGSCRQLYHLLPHFPVVT